MDNELRYNKHTISLLEGRTLGVFGCMHHGRGSLERFTIGWPHGVHMMFVVEGHYIGVDIAMRFDFVQNNSKNLCRVQQTEVAPCNCPTLHRATRGHRTVRHRRIAPCDGGVLHLAVPGYRTLRLEKPLFRPEKQRREAGTFVESGNE